MHAVGALPTWSVTGEALVILDATRVTLPGSSAPILGRGALPGYRGRYARSRITTNIGDRDHAADAVGMRPRQLHVA